MNTTDYSGTDMTEDKVFAKYAYSVIGELFNAAIPPESNGMPQTEEKALKSVINTYADK